MLLSLLFFSQTSLTVQKRRHSDGRIVLLRKKLTFKKIKPHKIDDYRQRALKTRRFTIKTLRFSTSCIIRKEKKETKTTTTRCGTKSGKKIEIRQEHQDSEEKSALLLNPSFSIHSAGDGRLVFCFSRQVFGPAPFKVESPPPPSAQYKNKTRKKIKEALKK